MAELDAIATRSRPRRLGSKQMKRILLADDEPNLRQLVRATLEGLDCEVMEASDGDAAFAMATNHATDLLILDWKMTGLGNPGCTAVAQRASGP